MVGFTSKINDFFSAVLPEPLRTPLHDSMPFQEDSLDTNICVTELSKPEVDRLLRIYWARYHPLAPVFRKYDFGHHYDLLWSNTAEGQQHPPLVDAVIALCIQNVFYSGLDNHLFGFQGDRVSDQGIQTPLGQYYFRKCLAGINYSETFAKPTLLVIQCYIIMILYLTGAGQLQAAYNMTGFAVRLAHTLNLDRDPRAAPNAEAELRARIWWTLVHLDFRCSRQLGSPIGVQLVDTTCPLPEEHMRSPLGIECWPYHEQSVRLTSAALRVTEAASRRPDTPSDHSLAEVEARAQILSEGLHPLRQWRDKILRIWTLGRLYLDSDAVLSLDVDDFDNDAIERTPSQVLETTLLELQYHDAVIGLHRPFIRFPRHFSYSERSPWADAHATTSLKHAMAAIKIVRYRMTSSEVLYGCFELYQWQWNAVLTLIGFMLAHPLCFWCPGARKHADSALEVFEAAGSRNSFAMRAASLTKHLCAKVDGLVALLKPDHKNSHVCVPVLAEKNTAGHECPSSGPEGFVHLSGSNDGNREIQLDNIVHEHPHVITSEPYHDGLWDWVEDIDPNAWLRYYDEVSAVYKDLHDVSSDEPCFRHANI